MNLSSIANSFIKSSAALYTNQQGISYHCLINKDETSMQLPSNSSTPEPGDALAFEDQAYLVLGIHKQLNGTIVASVVRVRAIAEFSRYPEDAVKDSFGRSTTQPVPHGQSLIHYETCDEGLIRVLLPSLSGVKVADFLSVCGQQYVVRQRTRHDKGIDYLLCRELS